MDPVTSAQIRGWSRVPFDDLVGPVDPDTGIDPLQEETDRVAANMQLVLGWFYSADKLPPAPQFTKNPQLWVIPPFYEPMLRRVIQKGVEWEAYRAQPENIEGVIDIDEVQSFTTRGYSETRITAGRGAVAYMTLAKTFLHPWPALNKLMTDLQNPVMNQEDVPQVRAPGMPGSLAIRWDQGRYVIDAGRPGADQVYYANGPSAPYSVYDERPGGMWFVPGWGEAFWPN